MPQKTPPPAAPLTRTRYGRTHPERVENELWELAIRNDWNGYMLQQHLAPKTKRNWQDFSHSSYRDTDPGPFWSWERFGRTSTKLPDGRIIHIAGEHEDSYDPDFCIYNDVVIEHPGGHREFYLYPKDAFPPTDFHSATLIGDEIFLIGSLGYHDLRRVGETQVLNFNTQTLRIEPISSTGEGPGWISRHTAERIGDITILVAGGNVQTDKDYETNTGIFELNLATRIWRRRKPGDMSIFPVSDETYRACRRPRYGTANPERIDNPFWLEMARRQWPASRARLHFGDIAPATAEDHSLSYDGPSPEIGTPEYVTWRARLSARVKQRKLARTIDDVVWTLVREGALKVTLPDGRRLLIGGEVEHYGDEKADSWAYNDIVVSKPDGAVEILTYPKAVFPHLYNEMTGVFYKGSIYIFGVIDEDRHDDRKRGLVLLHLNPASYEITELTVAPPPRNVNVLGRSETARDGRVVFPFVRQTDSDPEMAIAFDLETLTWSAPFPHSHGGK